MKRDRRTLLKAAAALPLASILSSGDATAAVKEGLPSRVRLSCNFYSFNAPLRAGTMRLEEAVQFCASLGFDAVDLTVYYFPGYPELPDDAYLYRIKRLASRLGLDISGTGVGNDFTPAEADKRRAEVEMVKRWVGLAARLGAPAVRVFSGNGVPEGKTREEVTGWVVDALRECAEYGARHGVMIVLQNHWDFVRTADQTLELLKRVDSEWLAVNLDIGSFRSEDPYAEIARAAPHAATWQLKESVFVAGVEQKTDLPRVLRIVRASGYRGYLPLETLGPGDPREKLPRFLQEVRQAIAAEGGL